MRGADGKRGGDGDVGQAEVGERAFDQLAAGRAAGDTLAHVQVQHRAAGVLGLQRLLPHQRLERVVGEAHGQLGRVGVVRLLGSARLQDAGPALFIFLGKAVGGAFGGRGLQVVEVAGFFLKGDDACAHMVQKAHGKGMAPVAGDVVYVVREVAHHLVDAVHAQGGEVVAQRAQVALGVGEQPLVHQPLNQRAFDFQAVFAQFQQAVQRGQQRRLVTGVQIAQAGAVHRDHAHAAGLLGAAKQAVAALEQLAQIQLQAAAHGAHHVRLQLRVHKVLKIRQAVLGRHVKQQRGVGALPRKVLGDVVGGNGEGEHPALGIARGHHVDVGAVDHVHLGLQLAVAKRHFHPADHRHLLAQVLGARPVKRQVGKRRLCAPARGHVQVVDQLLDALAHLRVVHAIFADERGHIGVERGKGLRPGPLVLQRAQKVHHLPHR